MGKKYQDDEDEEIEDEEDDTEEDEDDEDEDEDEDQGKKSKKKSKVVKGRKSNVDPREFKAAAAKEATAGRGGSDLPLINLEDNEVYKQVITAITQTKYKTSGEFHKKGDPIVRIEMNSKAVGLNDKYPAGIVLLSGGHIEDGEVKLSPSQNTAMTWAKEHKEELPVLANIGRMTVKGKRYKVIHIEIIKPLKLKKQEAEDDDEDEDEDEDD